MIKHSFSRKAIKSTFGWVWDSDNCITLTFDDPELEEYLNEMGILKLDPTTGEMTFGSPNIDLYFPSDEVLLDFRLRFVD